MSQLRKSASFRSRIPVRARVPQRRCSSPQPVSSSKSRQNKKNSKVFYDRYFSSSSFSSSDESHDSDEPLKVKYYMLFQYHRRISIQTENYLTKKLHSHPQSDIKLFLSHSLNRRDIQSRHESFHGDMQRDVKRT